MSKIASKPIENQLKRYLSWCENVKQSTAATIISKHCILGNFIKEVKINDLSELTNKQMDRWIESLVINKKDRNAKCSTNTIRTKIANVISWLRWESDMGLKMKIKIRLIAKPKPAACSRKWYTAEEIDEILESCEELLDEVMIRILFDTGLRAFEFAKLRLCNIHGRKIQVIGKGGKQEWVYISEYTHCRLMTWLNISGANDFVWIKCTRRQYYDAMTIDGIRKRIKRVFDRAGFHNFQMHELRHSFATDLRLKGASMDEIRRLMRHSSLQVTERYLHNLDGDMCDVWDRVKNNSLTTCSNEKVVILGGKATKCY